MTGIDISKSSTYTSSTHTISKLLKKSRPSPIPLNSSDADESSELIQSNDITSHNGQISVAEAIVNLLQQMGIKYSFGVSGGAIAKLWHILEHSSIEVIHCRHESGAGFAATEAYFASNRPSLVFATTGPGITNALTGLLAAKWEGAKVVFLSGMTSPSQHGRWASQETSAYSMPYTDTFTSGKIFDYATTLEYSEQLPEVARRLALGLKQPGGFIAHLSIPATIQSSLIETPLSLASLSKGLVTTDKKTISKCVKLLSKAPFAIWIGFGARDAAEEILQLAEKTGAAVMCSPRGKGIFPENHPQYVGVTGLAGHKSVLRYMQEQPPLRTLVLGTRLGEPTSLWNPAMVPTGGFIHVDIDSTVPGTAYPEAETFAIQSDIKVFVTDLLSHLPETNRELCFIKLPRPEYKKYTPKEEGMIRPDVLMNAIQEIIIDNSNAIVMADAGNSFAWAINRLCFSTPGRYRVSTGLGSMGHFSTGVLGATLGHDNKAFAIVGDGSMLMNNEVSTAVRYQIPAVWIVLNDGLYNMCDKGQTMQGFKGTDAVIPQADFAQIACSMGAEGIRIEKESEIAAALEKAMISDRPFIIDVMIDPDIIAPIGSRIESLEMQGTKS